MYIFGRMASKFVQIKGAVALHHFGDETFAHCLIPWGHYTARSKKFQPLVYMWSKHTLSFSNVDALLLKIWKFFRAQFWFLVVRFCRHCRRWASTPGTAKLVLKIWTFFCASFSFYAGRFCSYPICQTPNTTVIQGVSKKCLSSLVSKELL